MKNPIAWMAENSIAANLTMIVLVVGGLLFSTKVQQEVFPAFDLDQVQVSVSYPGASPAEVEQGILLSIEDRVAGVDGVDEVRSQALEGVGSVTVELLAGVNKNKVLQDIKNEIDRILTFPEEAEEPTVRLIERKRQVVSVILHGDLPARTLRQGGSRARDDLIRLEEVTLVELGASRPLEIAIEVPTERLRALGLTLGEIAATIRTSAIDLPGGEVRAEGGEVLLRTVERRDFASEFENIDIVSRSDGTTVKLSDIAVLKDGFAEEDVEAVFNGEPALRLIVYRVGDETPIETSDAVQSYVAELSESLPAGVSVTLWDDKSESYRARIDLLSRNALMGLGLVLLLLGLFLDPRTAFWVTLGIPISVVGAFLIFPSTGATINMVSLFAFIVTLGIIVDDAIMVGENVVEMRERGMTPLQAAIEGAKDIAGPVTYAVLTNIIAFLPLFFVPGTMGKVFKQIPAVVVAVFAISLIESLFVLPAHLSHGKGDDNWFWRVLGKPQKAFGRWLDKFTKGAYAPVLDLALGSRYVAPAAGIAMLLVCGGLIGGRFLKLGFFPRIDSDVVNATARLPFGAPIAESRDVRRQLLEAAWRAESALGDEGLLRGLYAEIGAGGTVGNTLKVEAALIPPEERPAVGGGDYSRLWRREAAGIAGLEALSFDATTGPGRSKAIDVELSHPETDVLELAAADLSATISEYAGIDDLDDGLASGKRQLSLKIAPSARSLGISARDLAAQVRDSFYGAEALRQQRGRNEIKVLVRLPEEERSTLHTVEELLLRTQDRGEVPLSAAATVEEGISYTKIDRRAGRRTASVTAEVDRRVTSPDEILEDLRAGALPDLVARYDGLSWSLEGEQKERMESVVALGYGLLAALFAIFAMLAIPLRSYSLPLIVLSGAPFGVIGALLGHLLLGYTVSLMTMFGVIALTGVVVNDSLVLIVTAKRLRDEG
ncbi:MAG: efflux RND transporter permease subunit, partial [Planctomycetota bacterium]